MFRNRERAAKVIVLIVVGAMVLSLVALAFTPLQ